MYRLSLEQYLVSTMNLVTGYKKLESSHMFGFNNEQIFSIILLGSRAKQAEAGKKAETMTKQRFIDLSRRTLKVSPRTTHTNVSALVEAEIVCEKPLESDRRYVELSLTEIGMALYESFAYEITRVVQEAAKDLEKFAIPDQPEPPPTSYYRNMVKWTRAAASAVVVAVLALISMPEASIASVETALVMTAPETDLARADPTDFFDEGLTAPKAEVARADPTDFFDEGLNAI